MSSAVISVGCTVQSVSFQPPCGLPTTTMRPVFGSGLFSYNGMSGFVTFIKTQAMIAARVGERDRILLATVVDGLDGFVEARVELIAGDRSGVTGAAVALQPRHHVVVVHVGLRLAFRYWPASICRKPASTVTGSPNAYRQRRRGLLGASHRRGVDAVIGHGAQLVRRGGRLLIAKSGDQGPGTAVSTGREYVLLADCALRTHVSAIVCSACAVTAPVNDANRARGGHNGGAHKRLITSLIRIAM